MGWQLFWGDYWIIDLDPDYRHVVIATPSRRYAWVLARDPEMAQAVWPRASAVLQRAGYDPAAMLKAFREDVEVADAADQAR